MRTSPLRAFATLLACIGLLVPRAALASGAEDRVHELVVEGDIDREDLVVGGSPRGRSWVSLSAFTAAYDGGLSEYGGMAVVGLALDRIGARAALSQSPRFTIDAAESSRSIPRLPVTASVARRAVAAAWRAAGLGVDDARIDAMVARAHWSTLLPETRVRAMRRFDDSTTPSPVNGRYGPSSAHLWLEARLTWKLDRVLYADDEPTIERVRLERGDVRARVAARVLAALAQWQRGWVDARAAPPDAPEAIDAILRMSEAESALEILTAGWFSAWRVTIRVE